MAFNISGVPYIENQTVARDFTSGGTVYLAIPLAQNINVSKRVELFFNAHTKTGSGTISAKIVQRFVDPRTGAISYVPVPQSVAAANTQDGDLAVRANADDANVTLSPGQVINSAWPTAIVAGDVFCLKTTQSAFGALFLELTSLTDTSTLIFAFNSFVEQQTKF